MGMHRISMKRIIKIKDCDHNTPHYYLFLRGYFNNSFGASITIFYRHSFHLMCNEKLIIRNTQKMLFRVDRSWRKGLYEI